MSTSGKVSIWRGKMIGMARIGVIAAFLATSGCVSGVSPKPAAIAGAPAFDPIAFFAGATAGHGRLHILTHRPQPVEVRGRGVVSDAAITLDQDVTRVGKPVRHRTWRLHRTGPGRYAGTLSDAVGPVVAEAWGSVLRIAFKGKGGLAVEQWLSLQSDGQSALNVMIVRKLGIVVARLDERIVRLG